MNVAPVIVREMRASARQPFTYNLRVLGMAALLVTSVVFGSSTGSSRATGQELFSGLHCTLLAAIWLLGPLLTVDCVSRERREGTLGLLFLTPLKGTDIVLAKGVAQGLRAVTMGLAVLPLLTIPFLLGGVGWTEALLSVGLNANAACWALAAGLLASAYSKARLRALVLGGLLTFGFWCFLTLATGWLFLKTFEANGLGALVIPWRGWSQAGELDWRPVMAAGFRIFVNAGGHWTDYVQRRAMGPLCGALGLTSLVSLLLLAVAVRFAGKHTGRSWQDLPLSPRRLWWRQKLFTPVLWLKFFRRWMRRKLERNPIGWLEQRTWSGRLVTWGWFAILISIYTEVLNERHLFGAPNELHVTIAWLLAGSIAMSAAGSLRRERESGVLELLLVSPVGERRIISGRLGGLWSQFAPAVGLLFVIWAYCSTFLPNGGRVTEFGFFLITFVTLPVFGLYFSLRCRSFLAAFLFTLAGALGLPIILGGALRMGWLWWVYHAKLYSLPDWELGPSWLAALWQVLLAVLFGGLIYRRLVKRAFPLERT